MPATGTVRCNACRKQKGTGKNPCTCGEPTCHIVLYWRGKHWRFGRYHLDGVVLDYKRAMNQLFEIKAQIKRGTFNPNHWTSQGVKSRRFEQQMDRWLKQKERERESGEFAPSTLRSYRSYSKNHFGFFDGIDVQEIDFGALEEFKDYLAEQGIKLKTRRNVLNALHAFFRWMHRKGAIITVPPFPSIEGDDSKVMTALSWAEQMKALNRLPDRHTDIFDFGFECGLRPGELCALKVGDIDPFRRVALIQRTYSANVLRETTKAKNKKLIPLSDRAYEIVLKHIKDKHPDVFLFINSLTKRGYSTENLRRIWQNHSKTGVTLYEAMRHSFCTQIVEDGASNRQAQELMRHTDFRSTEKYIHATAERHRELVNRRGRGRVIDMKKETERKRG